MSKVSTKQLAQYAAKQLQSGVEAKELSRRVAALLVSERRSREVLAFTRALEVELHAQGHTQVTLKSAYEVSGDVKKQVADLLELSAPTFNEVIDPSLIGGVYASTLDSQVDLTIAGQLQNFKNNVNKEQL